MDAFYASVEQRDNPSLRGLPIAVGGSPNGRGVVSTASYEARRFGVGSAMSSARAIRLCPSLIFVRPRFEAYKEASQGIREIFHRYTDLVEPLSLDEAYLDVTENKPGIPFALRIAKRIQDAIKDELDLSASAGVSYCKFLAKMASDYRKPAGISFIPVETAQIYIDQLEIDRFHGIGKKTAAKFKSMDIHNGFDLRNTDLHFLVKRFGKMGRFYHRIANGEDSRPVNISAQRKSASIEDTFYEDIDDLKEIDERIEQLARQLIRRLKPKELYGKTINLKVKYDDFQIITRSQSFSFLVKDADLIARTCKELLRKTQAGERKLRLIGLGLSNFEGIIQKKKRNQLEFDFFSLEEE